MKKIVIAIGVLLCAAACQNQEPTYIPASEIENYYIEKTQLKNLSFHIHLDPNCKEDLYVCPDYYMNYIEYWALCTKCIHPDTAKEIQSLK